MDVDSTSEGRLRVGRILHGTTAEGPGHRTAIWVQGCSIRCPDCINPHLLTARGGQLMLPAAIIDQAVLAAVEGITLLGGEPLDQVQASAEVARLARAHGLGVICFTGYTLEDLRLVPHAAALLDHVDLLVDGPFVAALRDYARTLVGSSNQRFIHLTDRYSNYDATLAANRVELRLLRSGEIEASGFLSTDQLSALSGLLRARRGRKPLS